MRKLIESTLGPAGGAAAGPPPRATEYRDEEVDADALERFSSSDAMLMGRVTYESFAAIWPAMTGQFADRVNSIRNYVFSSTPEKAGWDNPTIIRADVTAEVTRLKQQDGGDIAIAGHGRLAQALPGSGLTDELRLAVHPVLAGHGGLLFRDGAKTPLNLAGAKPLRTGVVVLSCQPAYGKR